MPYASANELPDSVKRVLPTHAQHMYKEAFNSAYNEYKNAIDRDGSEDRETVAHKVAWSAVKNKYEKGHDDKWHRKDGE